VEKVTRAGANVRAPRKAHMARDRKLEKIQKKTSYMWKERFEGEHLAES